MVLSLIFFAHLRSNLGNGRIGRPSAFLFMGTEAPRDEGASCSRSHREREDWVSNLVLLTSNLGFLPVCSFN